MALICNVDLEQAKKYLGVNLSAKYNGKNHKVYLRLCCDDFNLSECIEFSRKCQSVLAVSYRGMPNNEVYVGLDKDTGVYITRDYSQGNNISESDVQSILEETPTGVTAVINLPEDFTDLNFVWRMCSKYDRLRFCGGKLFQIDGAHIGGIGLDIIRRVDVKFNPDSFAVCGTDICEVVDITELEIKTSTGSSKSNSSSSSSRKESKPKKTLMFADIFNNGGAVAP